MARLPALLLALGALLVLVEAGLWGLGALWEVPVGRPRGALVNQAGFWPGLLADWRPNYRAQPWTMFVTYWVVHASPGHLVGNLAAMAWLGLQLRGALGRWQLAEIWGAAILGGAVAFGFLAQGSAPMIGASGGVFGLLGAWVALDARRRARRGARAALLRAGAICAAILVLSLLDLALRGGVLAWQAHLGGFLAGAAMALAGPAEAAPPR